MFHVCFVFFVFWIIFFCVPCSSKRYLNGSLLFLLLPLLLLSRTLSEKKYPGHSVLFVCVCNLLTQSKVISLCSLSFPSSSCLCNDIFSYKILIFFFHFIFGMFEISGIKIKEKKLKWITQNYNATNFTIIKINKWGGAWIPSLFSLN